MTAMEKPRFRAKFNVVVGCSDQHERTKTMTVVSFEEEPTGREREGGGSLLRTRVDVEDSRWVCETKAGVGVVSVRP